MTFARTKIQPPRPRANYVERGPLHGRLGDALANRRVVLVCAPAGYGKTMLLAQEAARLPAGTALAWVSADEGDDVQRLTECMLAALEPFDPPWRTAPESLLARVGRAPDEDRAVAAEIIGCNDCHTPWKLGPNGPEPDMTRMLSGHPQDMTLPQPPKPEGPWIVVAAATNTAWAGPWGVSYTANLTPDSETGLGKWTQRNFTETIRTGRHMGRGRPILPPMPIPMYKNFTDEDLEAIFTYLGTIPTVNNRVPEPLPPATPLASN